MTIFDELKARGLIAQMTDEEEIKALINEGKATFLFLKEFLSGELSTILFYFALRKRKCNKDEHQILFCCSQYGTILSDEMN